MWTISTVSGVLILLLTFVAGVILSRLFANSGKGESQAELESLRKENEKLSKDLTRSQKSHDRLENDRESWKHKYEDLENNLNEAKSEARQENKVLKSKIDDLKKELETAQAEKTRYSTKTERMKSELEAVKRKIGIERDGYKSTKLEIESQKLEMKKLHEAIAKLERKNQGLKEAAEKNFQKMADINEITSSNRRLKAKNVKLQQDNEYWEKKHYETHHELAALKLEYETLVQKSRGADMLN